MISENIKILRKKYNLTQDQLAEKVNVSRQSVTKWETGESLPHIDYIREIAKIFNTTVDALIGDETGNDGKELEKKLNMMILYLFIIGVTIFIFVLLTPIIEKIKAKHAIALFLVILFPLLGFWIKNYILQKKYIKENNILKQRELVLSTMPKDILGRPLNVQNTKEGRIKRFKFAVLDVSTFLLVWVITDLIIAPKEIYSVLFGSLIVLIIMSVIFFFITELKVRKYNKISQ